MMAEVRSERFAGQRVWINDALVEFDAQGRCVGIVQYADGRRPQSPEPLREQDIQVMRSLPAIFDVSERGTSATGPEGAAQADAAGQPSAEELAARHTRAELVQMAAERGIEVGARMTKREIAELLVEAGE